MKGNNTGVRVAVSAAAIPLILLVCYLGGYYFLITFLGVALIAYHELAAITEKKEAKPQMVTGFLSISLLITNGYFRVIDFELLILGIVMLVLFTELYRNRGSAILNLGSTFLGIFYIGLSFLALIQIREYFPEQLLGGYIIMSLLAGIWLCDSAAFFGGLTFGKHRLFERVSPKKSWEGAIFGFIFSVMGLVGAKYLVLDFLTIQDAVVIGVIIGTIGQMGDLAESLLKRDAGVKDSSALIPGHGGIFDRFDSLIAVSPFVFIYINFFVGK